MPPGYEAGSRPRAASSTLMFYLLAAMAAGTFTAAVLSVLGTFIVHEFTISRAQLGLVVAVNTMTGGLVSPYIGRVVDRLGGGNAVQLLFLTAAASFALTAVAPVLAIVFIAALVGGVAQAFSNPATNKVIAYRVPVEARATVTGIKQSGVQVALFLGGLTLPSLADWLGWRWAFVFVAIISLFLAFGAYGSRYLMSSGAGEAKVGGTPSFRGAVRWLSVYGLLMGFSGGALFFLPLFAEEELGYSVQVAGLAAAVVGLTAVIGRVVWAKFADNGARYRLALGAMAALAVIGPVVLAGADASIAYLWIGAVLAGVSVSSWNSVGMLAVIDDASAEGAGSASGWVLFGFLLGLGVAPPIYGRTFDTSGSYGTMWAIAAVTAALALVVMVVWWLNERGTTPR